jgi:hypothetical protein
MLWSPGAASSSAIEGWGLALAAPGFPGPGLALAGPWPLGPALEPAVLGPVLEVVVAPVLSLEEELDPEEPHPTATATRAIAAAKTSGFRGLGARCRSGALS